MKLKNSYFYTLRENAKDEDSTSGNLLVRAGMIKKVSSGIYMYLPLGLKALDNIKKIIKEAKIIICHGGVGTITDGLRNNKTIIACPRLKKYNEAKNDHQIQIVENFGNNGYIIPLLNPEDLGKALKKAETFKPQKYKSNTKNMVKLLENYIDNL